MSGRNESVFLPGPGPDSVHRTPISSMVAEYVDFMRLRRTAWSARVNGWYLRRSFGLDGSDVPHIGVGFLEEVTTGTVSRFLDVVVRTCHYAPKTGNRFREVLHRFFNWCMRQRDVAMPYNRNPITDVERFREGRPSKRFLTLADVKVQLDSLQARPVLQSMVATLIYAGLRRSELLWLTPIDVDLAAGRYGVLRIRAKNAQGVAWSPKTGKDRGVPISSSLRPFLEVYEAQAPRRREWFFLSVKGKRWDPDKFATVLREHNQGVGLPWSCLDFRHTFGSQLAMKGESLMKIAELMGNSPEICRRHYAALLLDSLVDTVEFPERVE